jgi:hypothetical protein
MQDLARDFQILVDSGHDLTRANAILAAKLAETDQELLFSMDELGKLFGS